jgi:hypothetical protein
MSYEDIDQLTQDHTFQGRVRACTVQEAENFRNDARPLFVALAEDTLRGGGATTLAFVRIGAASMAGAAQQPAHDAVDQSLITDAAILANVQANWEVVAGLFYDDAGAALP